MIAVRSLDHADLEAAAAIRVQAFGLAPQERAAWLDSVSAERMLGAYEGGRLVGTLIVHSVGQFLGGRSVPTGAIGGVAVAPESRRRGVGAALLDAALRRMHDEGLVWSILHPATMRPYRNLGWQVAADFPHITIPTRLLAEAAGPEVGSVRRAESPDVEALVACYRSVAARRHGWLDRPQEWAVSRLMPAFTDGHHVAVVDGPAGVDGYVRWTQGRIPDGSFRLDVHDLVATDARAQRTLWGVLGANSTQIAQAALHGGATADALNLVLANPGVEAVRDTRLMARAVDPVGALTARGYAEGVRVTVDLELIDEHAPWAGGGYRLAVEDGRASVARAVVGPDAVSVPAAAVGPLVTGYVDPSTLRDLGWIRGDAAALERLAAAFAGPRPTTADDF